MVNTDELDIEVNLNAPMELLEDPVFPQPFSAKRALAERYKNTKSHTDSSERKIDKRVHSNQTSTKSTDNPENNSTSKSSQPQETSNRYNRAYKPNRDSSSRSASSLSARKKPTGRPFFVILILCSIAYVVAFHQDFLVDTYHDVLGKAKEVLGVAEVSSDENNIENQSNTHDNDNNSDDVNKVATRDVRTAISDTITPKNLLSNLKGKIQRIELQGETVTAYMPNPSASGAVTGKYIGSRDSIGRPDGTSGTFLVKDSSGNFEIYTGEWIQGKATGKGAYVMVDKTYYYYAAGTFEEGYLAEGVTLQEDGAEDGIFKDRKLYSGTQYIFHKNDNTWNKTRYERGVAKWFETNVEEPDFWVELDIAK